MNDNDIEKSVLKYISKKTIEDAEEAHNMAEDAIERIAVVDDKMSRVLENQEDFRANCEEVNSRITKMEWTVKHHSDTMNCIIKDQSVLSETMSNIHNLIAQLKWMGVGAMALFALQVFGLEELIKKFF